ncbi:MAG: hypothetical protein LQ343_001434 [Gyalolechia ehrenbergii]|nr:MAG: hypothetical protein LQ343_001434 [Gyalolechia ehrenbergii]
MKQELQVAKKKAMSSPSSKEFYLESLKLCPNLLKLIGDANLETEIKNASDFSYSSSSYASPYARIVGDAGCFIDPFFSSGVHLAMVGGLSAATTISAAIRGDCEESIAAKWHSGKIAEGYSRFLLVVLSAYKQMRRQDQSILSGVDADNFDEAFTAFRPSETTRPLFPLSHISFLPFLPQVLTCYPVIQGTADTTSTVSHTNLDQTIDFCANAFDSVHPEDRVKVLDKVATAIGENDGNEAYAPSLSEGETQSRIDTLRESLDPEEKKVLDFIRARRFIKTEETLDIDHFTTNVIDGMAPHLERGNLTLVNAKPQMQMKTNLVQSVG